jgi:biopolymer transport protein ExbD
VKFKRGTEPEGEINLTPLIDVVFLLLLFFMISTTFTKETHMTINLPEAQGEARQEQTEALEIIINMAGEYTVNTQSLINNKLTRLITALEK